MKTPRPRPAQPSAPAVRVMYKDVAGIHEMPFSMYSTQVLVIDLSRKEEVVEVMAQAHYNYDHVLATFDYMEALALTQLTALQQHATAKRKKRKAV